MSVCLKDMLVILWMNRILHHLLAIGKQSIVDWDMMVFGFIDPDLFSAWMWDVGFESEQTWKVLPPNYVSWFIFALLQ